LLRVDVHSVLARHFMLPGLPGFLARYPDIQLRIGEGDRYVDLVREGVDCVLRVGRPADSGMVGRQVATLAEGTYASPAYLERHGTPSSPDDLEGHRMVAFVSSATGGVLPLEFRQGGAVREVLLPHAVSVAGAETYVAAARLGLGLIQVPDYRVQDDLARGTLVEVLPRFPPTPSPAYVLYPQNRQLSPRVRVFIDWLSAEFAARLPAAD
jgi:DNA-binding transcriptional LysR family regulator